MLILSMLAFMQKLYMPEIFANGLKPQGNTALTGYFKPIKGFPLPGQYQRSAKLILKKPLELRSLPLNIMPQTTCYRIVLNFQEPTMYNCASFTFLNKDKFILNPINTWLRRINAICSTASESELETPVGNSGKRFARH